MRRLLAALVIVSVSAGCAQPARVSSRDEYNARHGALPPYSAAAQSALGDWCAARRMRAEAVTHWERTCVMDPSFADAWRKLGFHKHGNRWRTPEDHARLMAGWKQTPEDLWLNPTDWRDFQQRPAPLHRASWSWGRYRIESTAPPAAAARAMALLEAAERKFAAHYDLEPLPREPVCIIQLLRTRDEFDGYVRTQSLTALEHPASLFHPSHGILVHAETADLDAALLHEATHALMHAYLGGRAADSLPPWLHEGLAEYWEHSEHHNPFVWPGRFHPAWPALANGAPLDAALNASWDEFYQPGRHQQLRATAALLCYFLEHGEHGRYADAFRAFVHCNLQGKPSDLAQNVAPLETLSAEFKLFVAAYSSK